MGYAPIYGSEADLTTISFHDAETIENGGKIYVYNNMLYQVENGKGIHITDISKPEAPVKAGFIKSTGCQEVAVKDGLIYTNNQNDLVILELTGNNVKVVKRMAAFSNLLNTKLPPERGWFECPDKTKGIVVGWKKMMLENPQCKY